MNSLLTRIFLSFWLMIVITIATASALGFFYAERARTAIERFEISDAMVEASEALRADGREGLEDWLESLQGVTQSLIYITDAGGRDILGRRLPAPVVIALRRFGDERRRRGFEDGDMHNLRPARPFTQLLATDGTVYTIFALPPQGAVGRWLTERSVATLALLALFASGLVSFLLARTISSPVHRLRDSASAIAAGRLDTRVPPGVSGRNDEIGALGKEFDRMASELQRSLERQTELTANVSHELRSPLARLRMALELARREAGNLPEFEKIEEETERLDALVGQILEFSRLDARSREQAGNVDLVDLVHSVVEDVRFEFGDKLTLEWVEPDAPVHVQAYENALRAAVSNIVRNAALHGNADGNVTVGVETRGGDALITVQDDGGGVPEADLGHLFEPFYRVSVAGARRAREGTGLGLAIAARATSRNGGSIEARNLDGGLLVTLRLSTDIQLSFSDTPVA
jgi:two-component system sensor histidine kinase CpxA